MSNRQFQSYAYNRLKSFASVCGWNVNTIRMCEEQLLNYNVIMKLFE